MTGVFLGLALGIPLMWLFTYLAPLDELNTLKNRKRELMGKALKHTGSFAELLQLQKHIILLAFIHLRRIAFPALVAAAPLVVFVLLLPEYASIEFAAGIILAYLFAKWRWKL